MQQKENIGRSVLISFTDSCETAINWCCFILLQFAKELSFIRENDLKKKKDRRSIILVRMKP